MRPTQTHGQIASPSQADKSSESSQLHLFQHSLSLSLSLCPVPACHPHYAPVIHSTWPPGAARFYHPPHSSAIKTQPTNTKYQVSCTPVISLLWNKRDGIFRHRKKRKNYKSYYCNLVIFWLLWIILIIVLLFVEFYHIYLSFIIVLLGKHCVNKVFSVQQQVICLSTLKAQILRDMQPIRRFLMFNMQLPGMGL